ncbi:MAG TPA: hypothetical protein VFQ39_18910, partial [Longimicrobium sp.]|nr:hypothetical protein [Longimicrobium sp.]
MLLRLALVFALVVTAACAGSGASSGGAPSAREAALVEEARAFMAGYARDLAAGDREAVAARYDDRGAYMVGGGEKELFPA